MLKIKDNVNLKELEKFGFKNGIYTRIVNDRIAYKVYITSTHHYIQIRCFECFVIAESLQVLLFDLIQAGLVEKVRE